MSDGGRAPSAGWVRPPPHVAISSFDVRSPGGASVLGYRADRVRSTCPWSAGGANAPPVFSSPLCKPHLQVRNVPHRNSVSFLCPRVFFASRRSTHWMTGGSIRAIGRV